MGKSFYRRVQLDYTHSQTIFELVRLSMTLALTLVFSVNVFVYFLSSLRARTAKTLLCRKVGFPPIPERVPKSAENSPFAQNGAKRAVFRTFWHFRFPGR